MDTYAEAIRLCNIEAVGDERYASIVGEPTLTVGATVWFLVEMVEPVRDYPVRTWIRVAEPGHGFRVSGGYVESDLASVLAGSGVRS